jgi:hypothetical protein
MSDEAPHPTGPRTGAGATALRLALWLFILLAGLAVVLVLPMIVVLGAMGGNGRWQVFVWAPIVFLAALYAVVSGLQAMADPRPRRIFLLAGIALVAFFSFPPFWYAEW